MPYYPPASGGGGTGGAIEHLADIGDVAVDANSQTLKFHAPNYWGSAPDLPKGSGRTFYLSNSGAVNTGAKNDVYVGRATNTASNAADQVLSFGVPGGAVVTPLAAFFTDFSGYTLGTVSIPDGIWTVNPYLATDVWVKGQDTTRCVITQAYFIEINGNAFTATVTVTGSGTIRTVTATSGIPFTTTRITASADPTAASFLEFSTGFYQVISRTSDTVVTILTPTGYANENTLNKIWTKLLDLTGGGDHTIVSTTPSLYSSSAVSRNIIIPNKNDLLGIVMFGVSSHARTIKLKVSGTTKQSTFVIPYDAVAWLKTNGNNFIQVQGSEPVANSLLVASSPTLAGWITTVPPVSSIKTSGTAVGISATAPTVGQALVASSTTACSWQSPITRLAGTTSLSPAVNTLCKQALAGANITVALPATHTAGDIIRVKMTTVAGGNTITIDPNAAQTIDGQATYVMSTDYAAVQCESDGANWLVTG